MDTPHYTHSRVNKGTYVFFFICVYSRSFVEKLKLSFFYFTVSLRTLRA